MSTSRLVHDDQMSHLGVTLPELSAVVPHMGMDREQQVEIRWKCTRIDMSRTSALELWQALGNALNMPVARAS